VPVRDNFRKEEQRSDVYIGVILAIQAEDVAF
jgi:hypothetical protein